MPLVVVLELSPELLDEDRTLGTRSDDRHVVSQHVEDLRQLVEAGSAQEAAQLGNARITLHGELRSVCFRIDAHGPELENVERLSVPPEADLAIENRPGAIEGQQQERYREHGGRQQQQGDAA